MDLVVYFKNYREISNWCTK